MKIYVDDIEKKEEGNIENNIIENRTSENKMYNFKKFVREDSKNAKIKFNCKEIEGHAYININGLIDIPANGEAFFDILSYQNFEIKLVLSAKSKIQLKNIDIIFDDGENLQFEQKEKIIVIVPDYKTEFCNCNDYIHKLNKEYMKNGIRIQVAAINSNNWNELKYKIDDIEIIKGGYSTLKEILIYEDYKILIAYSINEELLQIFEGYTNPEQQLILKIESNELLPRFNMTNYKRPYFVEKNIIEKENAINKKEELIRKFAQKENIIWTFESDRLMNYYMRLYDFKNAILIKHSVDKKGISDVKDNNGKIAIIKNFDNIASNKVDECILTILELAKRECFSNLSFDIYGEGNNFETLVEPVKKFKNVKIHKDKIIEKDKILKETYIYLNPSMYDMSDLEMETVISNNCYIVTTPFNIQYEDFKDSIYQEENFIGMANKIEQLVISKSNKVNREKYEIDLTNRYNQEIELIEKLMLREYTDMEYRKSEKPILTITIPSYNVEKYLTKCLSSLIYQRNVNKLEILVINDGSKDKTREIALKFEKKTNGIVNLVDKENAGHGSGVNMGMRLAKGKYFKILDSDDWINGENLAQLIDIMEKSNSDLILTKVDREYVPTGNLEVIINYNKLYEGIVYNFDDLLYSSYGFYTNPLFASCNYKTEKLREAKFEITEKKLYADHEFDAFALKCIDTVEYCSLEIYMYLIGREGQSVSSDVWKKRYKDHQNAIFTMLDKLENDKNFKQCRKEFIYKVNVTAMVIQQLNTMLDLNKTNEIKQFIERLAQYKEAYDIVKQRILEIGPCPMIKDMLLNKKKSKIKRAIKEILPYCLVIKLKEKGIIL